MSPRLARRFALLLALGSISQAAAQVPRAGTIELRVQRPDGQPLQGARLYVVRSDSIYPRSATSDAQGVIQLRFLPEGIYSGSVLAPGFDSVMVAGLEVRNRQVTSRTVALKAAPPAATVAPPPSLPFVTPLRQDSAASPAAPPRVAAPPPAAGPPNVSRPRAAPAPTPAAPPTPARDPSPGTAPGERSPSDCGPRPAGLVVVDGFCAEIFAEHVGQVRHLAFASDGTLLAATLDEPGILALRDDDHDGRADPPFRFGVASGTGIAFANGYLYMAPDNRVVRYRWDPVAHRPAGEPEVLVKDLPAGIRGVHHGAKSIVVGPGNALYVNIGSLTDNCQRDDRQPHSPGFDPCPELERRAGIWRFSATQTDQSRFEGNRAATGLRNAMALAFDPVSGQLWAVTHGRDDLAREWGYSAARSAENPAELMVKVQAGSDFGWPYCYYDLDAKALVLAPEYGGDGTKTGRCAAKTKPFVAFPGHWAPMAMVAAKGLRFGGLFDTGFYIAFHGSRGRAPMPEAGHGVVHVAMDGRWLVIAHPAKGPGAMRASGLAIGPDGALYIADDGFGRIYRVRHR